MKALDKHSIFLKQFNRYKDFAKKKIEIKKHLEHDQSKHITL